MGPPLTLEVEEAPPRYEDFEAYQHGDAGLMWELFDCIKWTKRERMEFAKNYPQKLVRKF